MAKVIVDTTDMPLLGANDVEHLKRNTEKRIEQAVIYCTNPKNNSKSHIKNHRRITSHSWKIYGGIICVFVCFFIFAQIFS